MSATSSKLATEINAEIRPLVHKLNSTLSSGNSVKVTFIAATTGEGTTTVATAFSLALHNESGKRVLLVSDNQTKTGIVETFISGKDINAAVKPVGEGVFGGSWTVSNEGRRQSGKTAQDEEFWKSLEGMFDVVVFDSPSLQAASDGVAFAQLSEATILVVAAESTRKEVVENLRDTLTSAGAKIAGVVMNKREFHIPESVYKRL